MHTNIRSIRSTGLLLASCLLAVSACEDETTGPDNSIEEGEVALVATSSTDFAYLSLANGGSVVSPSDPSTSTEWDIAFRRFSAKLNGGVAGPGSVAGANLRNNADATETQVVALTMADADAAFEAVTAADIAGATFAEDGLIPDPGASWFRFDPGSGGLVANPGAAWKVRTADGGYGVFRVAALNMAGQAPLGATVEFRYQAAGGTLGPINSVEISFAQGPGHIDLSSGAIVPPAACDWDMSLAPSFMIAFNAGCSAGSFPLDSSDDFTTMTTAADAPDYGGFLAAVSGAIPSTVDDASGVFWYNIEGNNRLWPTFNVFLVRVGSDVYKVQVTDYYSATGESGYPNIRFERLQ